ncbi:hypothetical protein F7725_001781 [Dissostichus mawsoni]|uniref:Uncharacterized protein n=1 Tax=Dissostichus mawsoni TaxID=36200 RepID=A0A7J5Y0J8_DISMA|nr:hypothetical protein F7725_001781 [Dissostichus mawsoni]
MKSFLVNTFHVFPLTPDPGDSRPMLLIGGSDRIIITHLNGSGLQPLRSLSANGTLALDFQHNQESVCWALSTESSGQLRCAETRNLRGFTREREIRTQQSLQHVEHMAIDWLTGNFYFVDTTNDKIFVCNQGGDTCVTIIQLDLLNPKGIALDPLMGKVKTTTLSKAAEGMYFLPLLYEIVNKNNNFECVPFIVSCYRAAMHPEKQP